MTMTCTHNNNDYDMYTQHLLYIPCIKSKTKKIINKTLLQHE